MKISIVVSMLILFVALSVLLSARAVQASDNLSRPPEVHLYFPLVRN